MAIRNKATRAETYQIKVGEIISVVVPDIGTFTTKVQDLHENAVYVNDIIRQNEIRRDKYADLELRAVYYDVSFIYSFTVKLETGMWVNNIDMNILRIVSPVTRIQRRNAYRLPCTFKVMVDFINDSNQIMDGVSGTLCKAVDISEIGMGVDAKLPISAGTKLHCEFTLGGEEYEFLGVVARCLKLDSRHYRVGMKFINDEDKNTRMLRRYIYKEQLRSRK